MQMKPKKRSLVVAVFLTVALFLALPVFQNVNAHKPLAAGGNNAPDDATEIPDHQVSWAIYDELQTDAALDYYRFDAREGERFYLQMTVPDLERYEDFAPAVAMLGTDLHAAEITSGENSVTLKSQNPIMEEGGMDMIILDYESSSEPEKFYEPFTQTSYLERQELVIDHLPASGVYYLVVFDNLSTDESGKYVLAVGEIEDFSVLDFFTTLPAAWFQTKLFFEDFISIALGIMAIAGIVSIPLLFIFKNKGVVESFRNLKSRGG